MYSENRLQGDKGSSGLELLANISEIEERSRAVEQAVTEGFFSLENALNIYKISGQEYMTYFLLKEEHKAESKQTQFFNTLDVLVSMYQDACTQFDTDAKVIMQQLEAYTNGHRHIAH